MQMSSYWGSGTVVGKRISRAGQRAGSASGLAWRRRPRAMNPSFGAAAVPLKFNESFL